MFIEASCHSDQCLKSMTISTQFQHNDYGLCVVCVVCNAASNITNIQLKYRHDDDVVMHRFSLVDKIVNIQQVRLRNVVV